MISSSPRTRPALVVRASIVCAAFVVALLTSFPLVATAMAAGPATVTVRVVGSDGEPLLSSTQVTTTTHPSSTTATRNTPAPERVPSVHCSWRPKRPKAAGAARGATNSTTRGRNDRRSQLSVSTIYYWSFWLDDKPATTGVCEVQLDSGDSIVFFRECYSSTPGECPTAPNVLAIEAPPTAEVGKPVVVTVSEYPNAGGEPKPAVGATRGRRRCEHSPQLTGADHADICGRRQVHHRVTGAAEGPPTIPAEAFVCAHEGNDGTCGTQAPGSSTAHAPAGTESTGAAYTGPYAVVAKTGQPDRRPHYKRGHAPRVLAGSVLAHTTVSSISLELRREYRGRCYAFDGVSTRFVHARCGTGGPFKVSDDGLFSYLLPEALPPGRYVLDIEATDAAGNHTTLARGTSRIVFYVQ